MVHNTLKSIKLKCVLTILYFCIFCSFFNVFAQDSSQPSFTTNKDIRRHFYTAVSVSDFTNDQLKPYERRSMIILDYINAIFHKMIDSNKELLSQYDINIEDIETKFRLAYSSVASVNIKKELLAELSRYDILHHFPFDTDAGITATFAHELAHILLNHIQQENELIKKLIEEFIKQHKDEIHIENVDTKTEKEIYEELAPVYLTELRQILKNNENIINLRNQQEIEADNLGFIIYLNTVFHIEHYTNNILHIGYPTDRIRFHGDPLWLQSYMLKDYLIQKYKGLSYPRSEAERIRSVFTKYSDQVDKKIENYKYTYGYIRVLENIFFDLPMLDHPTSLWRFWNNLQQEKNIPEELRIKNESKNKNITNTEYIKIDLSKFEGIDDIKNSLDKKHSFNGTLNLKKANSPILRIINSLFDDNSNISYQFFSSILPIEHLGVIQNDNTIVLKANDVFRAATLSLARDINNLGATKCIKFFSRYHDINRKVLEEISQHYELTASTMAVIIISLMNYLL